MNPIHLAPSLAALSRPLAGLRSPLLGLAAGLGLLVSAPLLEAGNPLINTVYSADPSGHVWPGDDRLWVYASHDQPGTNNHDTMISYHVFSTTDLVNWTDYGPVLHLKDVKWASSHMWAIDCVKKDDSYYLVYCARERGSGAFRTALAVSRQPQGPFTDIGPIKGVEWGQDPALFADDDGKYYLYWGCGGTCHAAMLSDDLRSAVPGTTVNLTSQLTDVFEGPWVHKYRGKYYLTYPGLKGGQWPEIMYYAVSDKPLGPFKAKGVYIPQFKGQAGTNHGSVLQYKGRWLALHHSMMVSGGMSEVRNLMADWLEYDADGGILPITPSAEGVAIGVPPGPSKVTVQLEAENGEKACGSLLDCKVASSQSGFLGSGYVEGIDSSFARVTVMVQSSRNRQARLKVRYSAPADQEYKVMINYTLLKSFAPGVGESFTRFPRSDSWGVVDLGLVQLKEGDNTLSIIHHKDTLLKVDALFLEQVD